MKITDNKGEESKWSERAFFETAMFNHLEWKASFISPQEDQNIDSSKGRYLSREFRIEGEIEFVRIYATSLGMYELFLNGTRVGDYLLTPGWTNYKEHLQYQTYDVTDMINEGENAVGATYSTIISNASKVYRWY